MDKQTEQVLQMIGQPAFYVEGGRILWCNHAAKNAVYEGQTLRELLGEQEALYSLWDRKAPLQIYLKLQDLEYEAKVRLHEKGELFLLERMPEEGFFSASAMVSTSVYLRKLLQNMMTASDSIFSELAETELCIREAETLNRSMYQMLRLCGQLSEGGRLMMNSLKPNREMTELSSYLDRFGKELQPVLEEAGWSLRYVPGTTSCCGDIDRSLVERAIYNLISNAMQYSTERKEIILSLQRMGPFACITVSDFGSGLPIALSPESKLQPFGDSRRGAGLGMEMVRQIARIHGGTMIFTSNEGGCGSKVSFSLRLCSSDMKLHVPVLQVDSYSGLHPALVELSDVLDHGMYHPDRV